MYLILCWIFFNPSGMLTAFFAGTQKSLASSLRGESWQLLGLLLALGREASLCCGQQSMGRFISGQKCRQETEHSSLNGASVLSLPPAITALHVSERLEEAEVPWNAVFSTQHEYHTHELLAAVVPPTRPTPHGEMISRPYPWEELLAVDYGWREFFSENVATAGFPMLQ